MKTGVHEGMMGEVMRVVRVVLGRLDIVKASERVTRWSHPCGMKGDGLAIVMVEIR